MSAGPRIQLGAAQAAAAVLMKLWELPAESMIVGSVRRGRRDVGDLELLTPAVDRSIARNSDAVYVAIDRTVRPGGTGLFGGGESGPTQQMGEALKGLQPGFLAASLRMSLRINGDELVLPVQVFRARPEAWGWAAIMRTGPDDFNKYILTRWKKAFGIPDTAPASVSGQLVDVQGVPVETRTEADVFRLARMTTVEPGDRDGYAERAFRAERAWGGEAVR